MTDVELARVFGDAYGYKGEQGGWIFRPHTSDPSRRVVVCQGWSSLAKILQQRGWIKVGSGVDWLTITRQTNGTGKLPRCGR